MKAKSNKSPFCRASSITKKKRKFEPNPWIDESSFNNSSIQKTFVKKRATKRTFNEAFVTEDDKILYAEKPF